MVCDAPCGGCRITAMAEHYESSSSASQSVTLWLEQLQAGESAAAQQLWQRYLERLLRLASRKLGDLPRRVADEEDVVLSASAWVRAATTQTAPAFRVCRHHVPQPACQQLSRPPIREVVVKLCRYLLPWPSVSASANRACRCQAREVPPLERNCQVTGSRGAADRLGPVPG